MDDERNKMPMCPLRTMADLIYSAINSRVEVCFPDMDNQRCIGEDCAWWDDYWEECAITALRRGTRL